MRFLDDAFEMGEGYVLDFSNRTFAEFFTHEIGVDIDNPIYSRNGTSKAKRLRTFLQTERPALVVKALCALWEYRETARRRMGAQEKLPEACNELSAIIERLGGEPLHGPRHSPAAQHPPVDPAQLARLVQKYAALSSLDAQPRGYAFERFLKDLFDAYKLEARQAFRIVGEQIDGSFQLGHETYLFEARWQNAQADAGELRAFHGKVDDKSAWTRGLFVSFAGFTQPGLEAFGGRRIVLMDGLDLHDTLRRGLSVADVIAAKVRRAAETGKIFVRVRDLIPE